MLLPIAKGLSHSITLLFLKTDNPFKKLLNLFNLKTHSFSNINNLKMLAAQIYGTEKYVNKTSTKEKG